MSYWDKHLAYGQQEGMSTAEQHKNSTTQFINENFKDSPFYRVVKVNGIDTEVRINDVTSISRGRNIDPVRYVGKYLLFRPNTKVNVGDIVELDNLSWLITDYQLNDIYPNAKISQCNNTLKYKIGTSKVQTGKDALGRPVYSTIDTYVDPPQPCIINTQIQSVGLNNQIDLPKERLIITLTYNDNSKTIQINDEFMVNGSQYKVTHFDFTHVVNGIGLLDIYADRFV